jgi:hypothetical protein
MGENAPNEALTDFTGVFLALLSCTLAPWEAHIAAIFQFLASRRKLLVARNLIVVSDKPTDYFFVGQPVALIIEYQEFDTEVYNASP